MKLHIGIAGPIASEHVAHLLTGDIGGLPKGYTGAPLTAVLIGELLKQGHRVSGFTTDNSIYSHSEVVKASGPNFDFYICPERPRAWRLNKMHPGRAMDAFAYERKQLFNTIKLAKPDLIHAHWSYEFALAAIKTGIPHLITCHDAPSVVFRFNPCPYRAMRYLMARQVFRTGLHFSTVSNYMATAIQHYFTKPLAIVPNPLADFVLTGGKVRPLPATKRIGLICNGWDARKNPKPALQAFADFHSSQPISELHMFGNSFGSGEAAQQWCEKMGLTAGMFFHGAIPHKLLIQRLDQLDLLLHPALEESFGVVIAEAMALGLPQVAGNRSGAVPWVVGADDQSTDYYSAVLTDVSNPAAISAAINTAFDENYPKRSAAGYSRARQMFSPKVISAEYMALYRQILPISDQLVV
jgi:glycosyltransferase involved in cell wall biosynthesis